MFKKHRLPYIFSPCWLVQRPARLAGNPEPLSTNPRNPEFPGKPHGKCIKIQVVHTLSLPCPHPWIPSVRVGHFVNESAELGVLPRPRSPGRFALAHRQGAAPGSPEVGEQTGLLRGARSAFARYRSIDTVAASAASAAALYLNLTGEPVALPVSTTIFVAVFPVSRIFLFLIIFIVIILIIVDIVIIVVLVLVIIIVILLQHSLR